MKYDAFSLAFDLQRFSSLLFALLGGGDAHVKEETEAKNTPVIFRTEWTIVIRRNF